MVQDEEAFSGTYNRSDPDPVIVSGILSDDRYMLTGRWEGEGEWVGEMKLHQAGNTVKGTYGMILIMVPFPGRYQAEDTSSQADGTKMGPEGDLSLR